MKKAIPTIFEKSVSAEELRSLNIKYDSKEEYLKNTPDYIVYIHLYNLKKLRKDMANFNHYLLRTLKTNPFILQVNS